MPILPIFPIIFAVYASALAIRPRQNAAPSPCISSCMNAATECQAADINCQCTSAEYQTSMGSCIATLCPSEIEAAINWQTAICAALNTPAPTITTTPAPSPTIQPSPSSTTQPPPSSTTQPVTIPTTRPAPSPTTRSAPSITTPPESTESSTSLPPSITPQGQTKIAPIVGGIVGGIAALLLTIGLCWFVYRRRRPTILRKGEEPIVAGSSPDGFSHIVSPFSPGSTEPSMVSNTHGILAPPAYQDEVPPMGPSTVVTSSSSSQPNVPVEAAQARIYEDTIKDFCATNRDLISPVLEAKLRAARYLPKDNPNEVPADYWKNTYGVDFFDLKRLQEAYERTAATNKILSKKETTAHLYAGAGGSSRPT